MALICGYCKEYETNDEDDMDKHIKEKHTCSICKEKYNNYIDLLDHYQTAHNKKPKWCIHCPAVLLSWNEYLSHLRQCHPNLLKTRICEYKDCDFKCETLCELKKHYLDKHKDRKTPIYCKYAESEGCTYVGKYMGNYKQHLATKHNEGPILKCPYCNEYSTRLRQNLIRHITKKHDLPNIRDMFKCPYKNTKKHAKGVMVVKNGDIVNIKPPCSFKGISIHELENHIEKEHPELLINFNIHKKKNYLNLI